MELLLDQIAQHIQQRYGLEPKDDWPRVLRTALKKMDLTEDKSKDLRKTGLSDERLLQKLAGHLTIKESYFFRYYSHFEYLCSSIKHTLTENPELTSLTIWSAGCAQGQEIYSLAWLLSESLEARLMSRIRLSGTDLDEQAIISARQGIFHAWSLRHTNAFQREKYFQKIDELHYQIKPSYSFPIAFNHGSLSDYCAGLPDQTLDIILFRNVSIYLTKKARSALYKGFKRILKPNALLIISPSDPFPDEVMFQPEPEHRSIFRLNPTETGVSWNTFRSFSKNDHSEHVVDMKLIHSIPASGFTLVDPEAPALTSWPDLTGVSEKVMTRLASLSNGGQTHEALELVESVIRDHPELYAAYLWRAKLQLTLGNFFAATNDLRNIVFHESNNHIARYWYALAMELNGESKRSLLQLKILIENLKKLKEDDLLMDNHTTAKELLSAALERREHLL
ncbi:hypothetical protein JXQ70_06165 [bacterium]|nr:hypothetical protein [bacterium]